MKVIMAVRCRHCRRGRKPQTLFIRWTSTVCAHFPVLPSCAVVCMFFSANLFFLSLFSQCHRLEVGSDFFRLFHHLVLRVFCCTPGPPDGHVHLLTNLRRLAVDVVEKQIDVLNEAYAGATHAEDGHDTGIRFKLDEVRTRAFTAERCRGSFPPLPPRTISYICWVSLFFMDICKGLK